MKNIVAIAVLAVLGVIAAMVFRGAPSPEREKVRQVISPVDVRRLDTIKVVRPEGIGDEKHEERYTLKKKGDTWRLVEPVDFPVVQSRIELMAKTLGSLRVIDLISDKPDSRPKFAVDDENGVKVTAMSGEKTLLDIIIGNSNAGVTFARLPGGDEIYQMQGGFKYTLDRSIKSIRERTIVHVEMDDLDRVTFAQGSAELTLAPVGEGAGVIIQPVGTEIDPFDAETALSVVRSAVRLNAVGFVDEPLPEETTGLGEGADKYTLQGKKDGEPYEVTVFLGNMKAGTEQVYTRSSESEQVYLISEFSATRLRAKAESFVKHDAREAPEGQP